MITREICKLEYWRKQRETKMLVSGRFQMEGRKRRKKGRDEGKKEGSQIHFFPVFHS